MILGNGRPNGYTPCDQCPLRKRPALREFSAEELAFVKIEDRRTARRPWREFPARRHAERLSLHRANRMGLALQDARRRPPADSQLRIARRYAWPAGRADERDGAFGRSVDTAHAVRLSTHVILVPLRQASITGLRCHLARSSRGAAYR